MVPAAVRAQIVPVDIVVIGPHALTAIMGIIAGRVVIVRADTVIPDLMCAAAAQPALIAETAAIVPAGPVITAYALKEIYQQIVIPAKAGIYKRWHYGHRVDHYRDDAGGLDRCDHDRLFGMF